MFSLVQQLQHFGGVGLFRTFTRIPDDLKIDFILTRVLVLRPSLSTGGHSPVPSTQSSTRQRPLPAKRGLPRSSSISTIQARLDLSPPLQRRWRIGTRHGWGGLGQRCSVRVRRRGSLPEPGSLAAGRLESLVFVPPYRGQAAEAYNDMFAREGSFVVGGFGGRSSGSEAFD